MTKSVCIIGGGIVGSTAAFYLSQETDYEITLIDKGIGQATKAAAGIISPWLSQRRNKEWYFLAREGAKFYQTFIQDLSHVTDTKDIYQKNGTILYKKNDKLLKKLENLAKKRVEEAPEIGEISLLDHRELKKLIPLISNESEALFVTGGARVDGGALVSSIHQLVAETQSFKQESAIAISYQEEEKKWLVSYESGEESFDYLVLATGAWLPSLLSPLGFTVDVRPQKGQLIELKTDYDTNNWPVIMPVGESDIIPFDQGKIVIGATHEDDQGYDLTPDANLLNQLKDVAANTISDFNNEDTNNIRIGTRAYTSDFSPFFGEVSGLNHLYVASGLGSSGLTTGPVIGKTIKDWILDEETIFDDYKAKPNLYIIKNQ